MSSQEEKYTVYFSIYGKKMKTTVTVVGNVGQRLAAEMVRNALKIEKITKEPKQSTDHSSEGLDHLKKIFGL